MTGETAFPAFLEEIQRVADSLAQVAESLKGVHEELRAMRSIHRDVANSFEITNEMLSRISNRVGGL